MNPESIVTATQPRRPVSGWTAARFARHLERALSDLDITSAQYRLLVLLARGAEVSTSLARKLSVSPPSVTTVVDGLVLRGAVERTPSDQDRRRILLALTDAGRDLLASAELAVSERFNAIAESLGDPVATRAALDALEIWNDALNRYAAQRAARGETFPANS